MMDVLEEDDRPTLPYGVEERFFAMAPVIAHDDDDEDHAWWLAQRRAGLVRVVALACALAFALGVVSAFR